MSPRLRRPLFAVTILSVTAASLLGCAEERTSGPCVSERPELRQPSWRVDTLATSSQVGVNGIWTANSSMAYAVGGVGDSSGFRAVVWKYDGTYWTEDYAKPGANFEDIHGTSPDNIWAVGGLIRPYHSTRGVFAVHWDGSRWREALVDSFAPGLLCTWAQEDGSAYAGGKDGLILRWDGATWAREMIPNSDFLNDADIVDIWGITGQCNHGDEELYSTVYGTRGTLLRRVGGKWLVEFESPVLSNGFVGTWGDASHGVYVLDIPFTEVLPAGSVRRLQDTTWSLTGLRSAGGTFTAIRGDEWGTVYVVKWGGVYRLVGDSVVAYDSFPLAFATDAWVKGQTFMVVGADDIAGVVVTGAF